MKHKLMLVLSISLLTGIVGRADDTAIKDVEKAMSALNDAFQKQDAVTIKKYLADDHIGVTPYYGGPQTAQEQIDSLKDLKLSEYTPGKMRFNSLNKDTVLITYELTMKGTFKGKDMARKSYVSAVWVKKDGGWREAFYQETALDSK
jgi:ketosteroid isomerase-like protein